VKSSSGNGNVRGVVGRLTQHRDEEREHARWLEEQIRALGGDADAKTEMSELVTRESRGIADVILDGDNHLSHLFHALLTAELADRAGWELLLSLADQAQDRDTRRELKRRLAQEEQHVAFIRHVVESLAWRGVMRRRVTAPTSP
jgi:bacterioferritin (cytochrome b1)